MGFGTVAIILFGFEVLGLSGDFNLSNPLAFIGEVIIFGLALTLFLTILSISYCPRCKFIIAWSRLDRNWLFESIKGDARCPKCGDKGLL